MKPSERTEMSRKAKCSNCGQWYYNDEGLFISRPSTYDPSMCPECNAEIDAQIASQTPEAFVKQFYLHHDEHCTSAIDGQECDCGEVIKKEIIND